MLAALSTLFGALAIGVTPLQLYAALMAGTPLQIVDVRTPAAYAEGHLPGALNVPGADLRAGLPPPRGLRRDRVAYLYCT